ncbi:hypothetical protein HU230_0011915 [Bradyrhizobium quebecense]|uniref:Uncharacterized protein n=1 Tax=Bradyrhizobium quebecense TaxID=2748629 RepID=A0A974AGV5_9BRAD|nr:hypothetical protein [Bradyrhizobium quebecense]UGA46697.1 hypothetical protein HU230_0011915 [Bradyrhizobium quebecense]
MITDECSDKEDHNTISDIITVLVIAQLTRHQFGEILFPVKQTGNPYATSFLQSPSRHQPPGCSSSKSP